MPSDRDRHERLSPSSPRTVPTDPAPASRTINIQSPNMLSPSRALGGQNGHHMSRSHQRDEQGARERQRQQDIESAMSMCESWAFDVFQIQSPFTLLQLRLTAYSMFQMIQMLTSSSRPIWIDIGRTITRTAETFPEWITY